MANKEEDYMTEEAVNLKRVPILAVHDDIPHVIGEAVIDTDILKKKAKVELDGELTEVVATVFRSNGE